MVSYIFVSNQIYKTMIILKIKKYFYINASINPNNKGFYLKIRFNLFKFFLI